MHLPPLRLLVIFDTVCQLGSMQRAARELNVSPPSVTQAIRNLEQDIGTTLMDRTAKPAVPTEAGLRLSRAIRNGLSLIESTIIDIQETEVYASQQITVSCTIGMATHWLMPKLSGFYNLYPDFTVNIQAPPSDLPKLTQGINVALRYGKGDWQDGETVKIFDEIACPVGTPDLIQSAIDQGGLTSAPLIEVRSSANLNWHGWTDYFVKQGITGKIRPRYVFDNYVQAVQAAIDGRGIMLGWKSTNQRFIEDKSLKFWPNGNCDFNTGYYLSYKKNPKTNPALDAFISWILEATSGER
ncbi:LysR family transcriptional regulator [Curvivirga sp.]|uniref:LysR family transcriptional regulator n=1 Tax=Curvivirga sp. TaxID=2856848 RepID=UPI003B5BAC9A